MNDERLMTKEEINDFFETLNIVAKYLIETSHSLTELEKVRMLLHGKNGIYTQISRELGRLIQEDRKRDKRTDHS